MIDSQAIHCLVCVKIRDGFLIERLPGIELPGYRSFSRSGTKSYSPPGNASRSDVGWAFGTITVISQASLKSGGPISAKHGSYDQIWKARARHWL
jgi:hypothetical protein